MKSSKTKIIFTFAFVILSIFLVSCAPQQQKPTDTKITDFQASQGLKKFYSANEIAEFLQKNNAPQQYYSGGIMADAGIRTFAIAESAAPSAKMAASSEAASSGAADYSQTNVQVAGVDEADFVKNDGKYIYVISGNKLVIVDAFPAENARVLSETKLKGSPRNMLVNKDRLVVFSDGNEEVYTISQYDYLPRPRYTAKTHVLVYDISNREEPELVKDYNMNGYYFESRMIGDNAYFISKDSVYYYSGFVDVPAIKESSKIIAMPEVFYFDNPQTDYVFHTIVSFDIFDEGNEIEAKTFMLGYSDNLYVSQNNIYISYQKNLPYTYYLEHNKERFFDIVVPLLPQEAQEEIKGINDDETLNSYENWDKISRAFENMHNSMEESGKKELQEKIGKAIEDYELKLEQERRKTIIHRISIEDRKIDYGAKGEVHGYLLNQFSMDEKEGHLRVATTTYVYARDTTMYNNVYVLDDGMNLVGKLEDIAPEERIYSTRFIGDRLYMVTFKNIDPLFVIDLSNPGKPEILGELKIPGFSNYLHPYDENHIIGVGKDTEANEWGGVSTKGVKIALFDVSDVANPKPLDTYEIGEAGTDSEALNEHKAFLFDKDKNLLVIPVREVSGRYYDSKYGYYRNNVWQGVYAFGLTIEGGFELKGKVTHEEKETSDDYYYYGSPNAVRRSLFMDDVLYTVSQAKIKMNDIESIEEINEVKLPYEKEQPYPSYVAIAEEPRVIRIK